METVAGDAIILRNELTLIIQSRLAYDGFYGDVLAPEEDGSGQKVLKATVSFDGQIVASASAGYLDDSRGGHLAVLNIMVDPMWRRQGIATAIYDAVESHYGDKVLPYPGNEGGAIQHFWYSRLKTCPDILERVKDDIGRLPDADAPSMEM